MIVAAQNDPSAHKQVKLTHIVIDDGAPPERKPSALASFPSKNPSQGDKQVKLKDTGIAGGNKETPPGNQTSAVESLTLKSLHIATHLMDTFMSLAESNTQNNLETCGLLAGSLKNDIYYITVLIIPKQKSTSDSVSPVLFWLSLSLIAMFFQLMTPETVSIVMAPQDSSMKYGIFRLTVPEGMAVIKNCNQQGFHPHSSQGPIYDTCNTGVHMDPDLKFNVFDLR
ncbi:unnamed protein product [Thlaspi arvense]|uniref:AMSH-like ubiquitin thioesterase 2 n=1 Tax=Thlaspi arvense TaxID=13288 RepID=A0AAU9R8E4_THLAR|nr:unnamed protein product [Thlaspi arvense]